MNLEKIQKEDLDALQGKSGIYWTFVQEDKILARRVKNFSTSNMYGLLGAVFYGLQNNAATGTETFTNDSSTAKGSGVVAGGTNNVFSAVTIIVTSAGNAQTGTMVCLAGTDTTHATTVATVQITSAASPTPTAHALSFSNLSNTMAGLQWTATWLTGSFGATGSTNIGEFGLEAYDPNTPQYFLFNRLAVADQNIGFTSPISVNNLAPFSAVITLVL